MRARRFRKLRAKPATSHHNVYVVLLDSQVREYRRVQRLNPNGKPDLPCIYVGMTGLTPEARFANHKAGIKSAALTRRFGIRLLPELYEHLNPMPYEAAAQMEKDLTGDLRQQGYTVLGGT